MLKKIIFKGFKNYKIFNNSRLNIDKQLDKIKSFGCLRNNCFAIMEIDSEGNVGETIDVVNTYDEAIKSAEELVLI